METTPLSERGLTLTTNGDYAHLSTGKKNLDLFGIVGALRGRQDTANNLFEKAFHEDVLVAVAQLFYLRDVRGGAGERDTFRAAFTHLASKNPKKSAGFAAVLPEVVQYGRWDDLVHIMLNSDGVIREQAEELIREQWAEDIDNPHPSLMAKWLPSPNATSETTKASAKAVRRVLGLREVEYRTGLSRMRSRLKLVENALRTKNLGEVDYSKVPSRAMRKYSPAFARNDERRFQKYLDSLSKGEVKAKADGLFPHEIVGEFLNSVSGWGYSRGMRPPKNEALLEAQWAAMRDALVGEDTPLTLPVCDVSGSMFSGTPSPIAIAVALTLLMSEQLPEPLRNKFAVFASTARIEELKGKTLRERISSIIRFNDIASSTNLDAAFDLIFEHNSKKGNRPIERIVIPSDMQFNGSMIGGSAYERSRKKFQKAGVVFPKVVFWYVEAPSVQFPATADDNVQLVSGFSKSVLADVISGGNLGAVAYMLETLSRYAPVAEKFYAATEQ